MDQKVWSKAAKDTVGLALFFDKNIDNYLYPERILSRNYICNEDNIKQLAKYIRKRKSDEYILNKINKNSVLNLSIKDSVYLSEENNPEVFNVLYKLRDDFAFVPANYPWEIRLHQQIGSDFFGIYDFIPPHPKPFKEVKGLVISDYQKILEEEWLSVLKDKYEVVINKDLLNALKENNLNEYLINYSNDNKESNEIPVYGGSFERAFINASNDLGTGKSIYFKWDGDIYTTELAP